MDLRRFLRDSGGRVRSDGLRGISFAASRIALKGFQSLNRFADEGAPIYEEDWDLLVVLDACRYDLMSEVFAEYDFLPSLDSRWSVNSVTRLWMEKNFINRYRDEIARTHYVTGNPFSEEILEEEDFGGMTEVWRHAWTEPGTVPPEALTDAAIRTGRDTDTDRIIAHYMQPHCPFIPAPEICNSKDVKRFGNQPDGDVWDRVQRGLVGRDEAWQGYKQNLELVLESVDLLLRNIDANKVVVTSDHGNAIGEWGLYGHTPNTPLACMRKVPWIETRAVDEGTYQPSDKSADLEIDREEQLESLGYL